MKFKDRLGISLLLALFLTSVSTYGQSRPQSHTGEATITVSEQFFNSFLDAIFDNLKAPSTPLVVTASDKQTAGETATSCPSVITLQREHNGVRTAVRFVPGKIVAPLAFSGSYNSTLMGCLAFSGTANSEWNLEFDRNAQTLQARISITEMRLDNIPSLAQGSILKLVQAALDSRINPLKIVRPDQLSSVVPIAPSGGSLRLRAKEVRPEIVSGALQLHIVYEFLPEK